MLWDDNQPDRAEMVQEIAAQSLELWLQHYRADTHNLVPYLSDSLYVLTRLRLPQTHQLGGVLAQALQTDQPMEWLGVQIHGRAESKALLTELTATGAHPQVVSLLLTWLLQTPDKYLRSAAASALSGMGEAAARVEGVVLALLQALQQTQDDGLRSAAANALSGMGKAAARVEGVVAALLEVLRQTQSRQLRYRAVIALGKMSVMGVRIFVQVDSPIVCTTRQIFEKRCL